MLDTGGMCMLDKVTETSLLFDFYGNLLTENQRNVMSLYYNEDFSLAEIAETNKVSRQAVHISLKNAEKSLNEYEKKLGLLSRWLNNLKIIDEIHSDLSSIYAFDSELLGENIKYAIEDALAKLEEIE